MTTRHHLPLQVRPATEADIARIIEVQFSAFEGDPYQKGLYPSDNYYGSAIRQIACEQVRKNWHADPTARWLVCTTLSGTAIGSTSDDALDEIILGFALWNVYATPRPESEWQRPPQPDWLRGREREIAFNFLSMNQRVRAKLWAGNPYMLLSLLCVHQDWQRRGAGRKLVEWGIERAAELGLSIQLEASKSGEPLYRTMGFRDALMGVVKREEWDGDRDLEYMAMVKDAPSKDGQAGTE